MSLVRVGEGFWRRVGCVRGEKGHLALAQRRGWLAVGVF